MTREESLIPESALTRRAVTSAQEMLVNDSRGFDAGSDGRAQTGDDAAEHSAAGQPFAIE